MGNSNGNIKYGFDYDAFYKLIDNMYDEVYVTDNNYKLLYVNKSCARHYGVSQDEMIGKTSFDFDKEKWWTPGFLTPMYKDKKAYSARQFLSNGTEVLTIATPIFDKDDNIEYVIMNVRDDVNDIDLYNDHCEPDVYEHLKEPDDFVFHSESMQKIYDMSKKISNLDTTCIITGETGVGKTMLAKRIHSMSNKKEKPFISDKSTKQPYIQPSL